MGDDPKTNLTGEQLREIFYDSMNNIGCDPYVALANEVIKRYLNDNNPSFNK